MGYLYDLVIESGHFGRIRFPYVWDGNAVVYRRLRPLEQFVRDDGLCGLGYGVRGLLFVRKSTLTFALATLFGGIILFVSGLSWMDPQINPLVPVLKSPWLMFHVAVIVGAYGFFGISCLIGLTNLVMMSVSGEKNSVMLKERVRELSIVNEMSLWIGLALMTIGTFLGAVWANEFCGDVIGAGTRRRRGR